MRGLLYSHSEIVFINTVELYEIETVQKYFKIICVTFRSNFITAVFFIIIIVVYNVIFHQISCFKVTSESSTVVTLKARPRQVKTA